MSTDISKLSQDEVDVLNTLIWKEFLNQYPEFKNMKPIDSKTFDVITPDNCHLRFTTDRTQIDKIVDNEHTIILHNIVKDNPTRSICYIGFMIGYRNVHREGPKLLGRGVEFYNLKSTKYHSKHSKCSLVDINNDWGCLLCTCLDKIGNAKHIRNCNGKWTTAEDAIAIKNRILEEYNH